MILLNGVSMPQSHQRIQITPVNIHLDDIYL